MCRNGANVLASKYVHGLRPTQLWTPHLYSYSNVVSPEKSYVFLFTPYDLCTYTFLYFTCFSYLHVLCVSVSYLAPDSPPQGCVVIAMSSTSFGVSWMPPDPPNGDIANYTIVYRPVEAVADYDPSTLEGIMTNYTESNTTMLVAVNLQPAVWYSIQLAATNQVGTGPFSQDLQCTVLTEDDCEW